MSDHSHAEIVHSTTLKAYRLEHLIATIFINRLIMKFGD